MDARDSDHLALRARGIGKSYTIARAGVRHTTLAESLGHRLTHLFETPARDTFWALRDIDFDIYRGDVVGIVGRNGAGKSTLLKLLSRITEPTAGRALLYGRVGSLLEVGTGFHPELTGRENIYLNGAILGMTHREIDRAFDAIVEFAEVAAFLETPVKRYSSGMYVRLAFSVAAHLNPEILIVDEVLAVGDAEFQKKCLGKMHDVAQEGGRTVLFVSHNMAAVRALCSRALLLSHGRLELDADTESVIGAYLRAGGDPSESSITYGREDAAEPDTMRFRRVRVLDGRGETLTGAADWGGPVTLAAEYEVSRPIRDLRIGFSLENAESVLICGANDAEQNSGRMRPEGVYETRWTIPGDLLNEARYFVSFRGDIPNDRGLHDTGYELAFNVEYLGEAGATAHRLPGVIRPRLVWEERRAAEVLPAA
jgi:lipopolysaccharide transport system ATP-binding protein